MDQLRQYFIAVVAAALLCGIITGLFPGSGASAKLAKLISGILLTMTVLHPVTRMDLSTYLTRWTNQIQEGIYAANEGTELAGNAMAEIIKEKTKAYILDKAGSLGLEISVEVELSTDDIPMPVSVRIAGNAAPYPKLQLQSIIEKDLGIPMEDQKWIG